MNSQSGGFRKLSSAVLGVTLASVAAVQAQGPYEADAFRKALEHQRNMPPATWLADRGGSSPSKVRTNTVGNIVFSDNRWEFIGPSGIQVLNGTVNPYTSGRVSAVAIDNRTPGTAVIASAYGGAWKTANYGFTWTPLGDGFPYMACSSVAIDPTNSRNIYIGIGDFKGELTRDVDTFSNARSVGIMKSVNGGNTWVNIGVAEMGGTAVSDIAIDPDNPRIVVATTGTGANASIWRSLDGGTTWANVTPKVGGVPIAGQGRGWRAIRIFNPNNRPRTSGIRYYYASCEGEGIYRSADRGATWTKLDAPLRYNGVVGASGGFVIFGIPSAVDPNTVYVMDGDGAYSDGRIFRGVRQQNDTYRWTDVTGTFPTSSGPGNNWANSGPASAFTAAPVLLPDTSNPFSLVPTDLVFGGISQLASALNGGPGWSSLSTDAIIGRIQSVAYDPFSPVDQLVATDGGVFGTTYSPDTPTTPFFYDSTINRTLGVTQFFQADFHPTDPSRIIGGASLVGSIRADGDLVSGWKRVVGGWGTAGAFNPAKPAEQYVVNRFVGDNSAWPNWRIYYTSDNWQSGSEVSPGQFFPGATTTYAYPYSGGTDSSVSTAFQGQTQAVTPIIVVDPAVATASSAFGGGVSINPAYLGTNALWRFDPTPAAKAVTDPTTQSPANGQWRQVGTTTFDGVVTAIAVGLRGNAIYVGTAAGSVYVTENGAIPPSFTGRSEDTNGALNTNWQQIKANLPNRPVTAIDINPLLASDILVTVGGTGTKHIWRCQDTTANNILYTQQDGLNAADLTSLPDIPVNGITRDPGDPVNIWYASTDLGVLATTDKGSNWYDATQPLGLPNVKSTSIRAVSGTGYLDVATYGRGAWRFNLNTSVAKVRDPKLSVSYSLSRSGAEIFAVLTVKNASGATVGPALNTTINTSTITSGATITPTTSIAPGGSIFLGTIGAGTSKSITLRFPGSAGPSGSAATFGVNYSYLNAPASGVSFSSRTRLP